MRAPRRSFWSRAATKLEGLSAYASRVAGLAGSLPVTTSRARATSLTVRPTGPTASFQGLRGMTPARPANPRVVRMVARDAKPEGFDSELQVSVPKARGTQLRDAAMGAAAARARRAQRD